MLYTRPSNRYSRVAHRSYFNITEHVIYLLFPPCRISFLLFFLLLLLFSCVRQYQIYIIIVTFPFPPPRESKLFTVALRLKTCTLFLASKWSRMVQKKPFLMPQIPRSSSLFIWMTVSILANKVRPSQD